MNYLSINKLVPVSTTIKTLLKLIIDIDLVRRRITFFRMLQYVCVQVGDDVIVNAYFIGLYINLRTQMYVY